MNYQVSVRKIVDMSALKNLDFWKEREGKYYFECKIYDANTNAEVWTKTGEPVSNILELDIRSGFFIGMKSRNGFNDDEIQKIIHYWILEEILAYRISQDGYLRGNKTVVFPGNLMKKRANEYRALLNKHSGEPKDEEELYLSFA